MQLRSWILAAALVAIATPALGVVKVYNSTPPNGEPGDRFQFSTTLCPPIQVTPGQVFGVKRIDDTGGGTVTMTEATVVEFTLVDFGPDQLTAVFGPGSFVFVNATPTNSVTGVPVTVAGSTAPSGTVAWGLISGWTSTGVGFCIASPQTICTGGSMIPHGITSPLAPIPSPTYDLGTWSFDAEGDFAALSNYIIQTNNGGTANRQRFLRGSYVGAGVPALPLIGAGALAIGLLAMGTRSVMRKK